MRKVRSLVLAGVVAATGLIGFTAGNATAAVPTDIIRIQGFAFHPNYILAQPGEQLTGINVDLRRQGIPHTITADNHAFDVGLVFRSQANFNAPPNPGRYFYHCEIHPFMTGILDVSG